MEKVKEYLQYLAGALILFASAALSVLLLWGLFLLFDKAWEEGEWPTVVMAALGLVWLLATSVYAMAKLETKDEMDEVDS